MKSYSGLTAQHSTAQHSTAQHSTAQHSTAQHSTAQHMRAEHAGRLTDGDRALPATISRSRYIPVHTATGKRAQLQTQGAVPSRHSLQQRHVVKRPTCTPLRWELEHRQQVVGALLQVGGSKALGGKSCEAGQQRNDCTPDEPLLALSEAQHGLHYLAISCQHKFTCAHKGDQSQNGIA